MALGPEKTRNHIKVFTGLFDRESLLSRLARLTAVYSAIWGVIQILDRFTPTLLPSGKAYLVIYILFGLIIFLQWELLVQKKYKFDVLVDLDAVSEFANSVVRYAKSLGEASPPKDQTLLELRSWSSRLLHLTGNNMQREVVGKLALGAAGALNDKLTQASILIDDLGWCVYQQHRPEEATANIEEGLRLLTSIPEDKEQAPIKMELVVKAKRHLAGINFFREMDIEKACEDINNLRNFATSLPEGARDVHLAQLNHTEASFIYQFLKNNTPPGTIIDPTGDKAKLYDKSIQCIKQAEEAFSSFGDIERQVKSLKLYVELLKYSGHVTRIHTAESRLSRLEKIASRKI